MFYCIKCQQSSEDLGDLTGGSYEDKDAENAAYLGGEICNDCGGTIEMLPT